MKFGRIAPRSRGYRLSLKNYLMRSFSTPPLACDYRPKADAISSTFENDVLSCCTSSAAFHIEGLLAGNAGNPISLTDADVIDFYSATTGYVPGNPATDQGGDEVTVLNAWMQHGLIKGQHKIRAWIAVNPEDPQEYRAALFLFENLYFGVGLPDAWINPEPKTSGFIWDLAGPADQNSGHAFCGVAYNEQGVVIDTWGMTGLITDAAVSEYACAKNGGALYAVLSDDAIIKATHRSPAGFDLSQLLADMDSLKA